MPYVATEADRAFIASLEEPFPPSGHAPLCTPTMALPGWFYAYPAGSPESLAAQANYDKQYFAKHPEEREKYGYKGP
ncbi:MAG: hypothetical protein LBV54_05770 [Puniceicoccales bacterium]|jgi:hypothetical protein|nr:hypothetical protein [Puniceicoccales bacterium]